MDRESSEEYALSFFGGAGTIFIADNLQGSATDICVSWYRSLLRDPNHRELVLDVRALTVRNRGRMPSASERNESALRGRLRELGMDRIIHVGDEEGEVSISGLLG